MSFPPLWIRRMVELGNGDVFKLCVAAAIQLL